MIPTQKRTAQGYGGKGSEWNGQGVSALREDRLPPYPQFCREQLWQRQTGRDRVHVRLSTMTWRVCLGGVALPISSACSA